jgi:hypothetical protein
MKLTSAHCSPVTWRRAIWASKPFALMKSWSKAMNGRGLAP